MDEAYLRQNALNLASARVPADASVDTLLAEAEKLLAWMKGESGLPNNAQHESAAAVKGQG